MAFCRLPFHGILPALLLGLLMDGSGLSAREIPPGLASAAGSVRFSAFVNWDFRHRQKLGAWKTTSLVIQRTLELWYPEHVSFSSMDNGTPETFRQFLHGLPGGKDGALNLVYLCSHQSPAGEWDFPAEKLLTLDALLDKAGIPGNPRRIVILDTCFAAAAGNQTHWPQLAPVSLFASQASEETPEVNFHSPQPVDFARRYPASYAWLKACLGREWDGKISFLGFVWVETFLRQQTTPRNTAGWIGFMEQCRTAAAQFRENVSKKSSSQITLEVNAGPGRP